MHRLTGLARRFDPTRLYAWGSNNFYGEKGADPESDFYTSACCGRRRLRACGNKGPINIENTGAARNFDAACDSVRKGIVPRDEGMEKGNGAFRGAIFGFEVGQYQVLPDFTELNMFHGVTRPDNLTCVQERARRAGLTDEEWKRRMEATGELALTGYREDVESVLRTEDMSGLSLLGLQDFPGQGTALIGMLNSHMQPKSGPFAAPDRFRAFFRPQAVLAHLPRYTWVWGEAPDVEVKIANYGKETMSGKLTWSLSHVPSGRKLCTGEFPDNVTAPVGELTRAGFIRLPLKVSDGWGDKSCRFDLTLEHCGVVSVYPVWVYTDEKPQRPAQIYETGYFDDKARGILEEGGMVYLTPSSTQEALPHSVRAQFTTDFWSVGTFPNQDGAMGQLIDKDHPLFADFPTQTHAEWQWWPMATRRAIILPEYMPCIVAEMDSYATLRPMAQLFEARCMKGRVLVSSMGLQELQQYPEARALLRSIYRYMASDEFEPASEISPEILSELVTSDQNMDI